MTSHEHHGAWIHWRSASCLTAYPCWTKETTSTNLVTPYTAVINRIACIIWNAGDALASNKNPLSENMRWVWIASDNNATCMQFDQDSSTIYNFFSASLSLCPNVAFKINPLLTCFLTVHLFISVGFLTPFMSVSPLSGPWFNTKMSYQHSDSHCGNKMIVRSSYFCNRNSYTGKTAFSYWINSLVSISLASLMTLFSTPTIAKSTCNIESDTHHVLNLASQLADHFQ